MWLSATWFVVGLSMLAVVLDTTAVVAAPHWRPWARIVFLPLAGLVAVAAILVIVNYTDRFYVSWAELVANLNTFTP